MTTTPLQPLAEVDAAARSLLFTDARTANSFADTPVTDDELRSIWDLARFAPTMANSQPLRMVFVRTEAGKARLLPLVSDGNRDKTAAAPVTAVLAFDSDFHEHFPTAFPARGEAYRENFGAMAVDARGDTAKYSAALAAGVFLLAVRSHGLAAGPMGGFDREAVDAEFLTGTTWHSQMLVNIGHPGVDPWFDRLPRLATEDVIAWA